MKKGFIVPLALFLIVGFTSVVRADTMTLSNLGGDALRYDPIITFDVAPTSASALIPTGSNFSSPLEGRSARRLFVGFFASISNIGAPSSGSAAADPAGVPEPGIGLLMTIGLLSIGGASVVRRSTRHLSVRDELPLCSLGQGLAPSSSAELKQVTEPSVEQDEFEIRRRAFFSS